MKRWCVLSFAVAGLVLLSAAPGNAFFELGKTLKIKCSGDPNSYDRAFCLGYIAGIADAMKDGNKINDFKACIPDDVTEERVLTVVREFLKENPGNLQYTADDLVAFAFQDAFPCK